MYPTHPNHRPKVRYLSMKYMKMFLMNYEVYQEQGSNGDRQRPWADSMCVSIVCVVDDPEPTFHYQEL